ncbi:MAG: hypothetical protein R3D60_12635 [Paracoccaceae bacterium]
MIASIDAQPIVILTVIIVIYLLWGRDGQFRGDDHHRSRGDVMSGLGYDIPFWGVLMLVVVVSTDDRRRFLRNEPLVLKVLQPDVRLGTVMRVILFVLADSVKIVLLVAFPVLSLWLPSTM